MLAPKIILVHLKNKIKFMLAVSMETDNTVVRNFINLAGFQPAPSLPIILIDLSTMESHSDPHGWGFPFEEIHNFIIDNYDDIESGDSVDYNQVCEAEVDRVISELRSDPVIHVMLDKTIFDYHNEEENLKKEDVSRTIVFSEEISEEDSKEIL